MWLFKKKKNKENAELNKIIDILQKEPEIKLSVKSAVMYEALSGKKFSSVDMTQEDTALLMYCAFVCSTKMEIDIQTFGNMLENKDLSLRLTRGLKRLERFMLQFNRNDKVEDNEDKEKDKEKKKDDEGFSITDMVDKLIFKYGVSDDYVMQTMELWELKHFFAGAEKQYMEDMEEKRLWTFLQVAPQLDLKKCKTLDQFFPLPWSKKKMEEEKKKELERETVASKQILGKELKLDLEGL